MPITNHTLDQTTQANGGTSNVVRLYDQDGVERAMYAFYAEPSYNVEGRITSMIADLDIQLAEQEFQQIVGGA